MKLYIDFDMNLHGRGDLLRHWLVRIREGAGLSQYETAFKAGISQSYYAAIESGQRGGKLPQPTALTIAEALSIDWTRFYEEDQ